MDGFHPVNVGKLMLGDPTGFQPCTPAGIRELLVRAEVKTQRRGSGRAGTRQHRGQADGRDALPEGEARQRHGDDLPFGARAISGRIAGGRTS